MTYANTLIIGKYHRTMSAHCVFSSRVRKCQRRAKPCYFSVASAYKRMCCMIETMTQIVILPKHSPIIFFFACCDFVELQVNCGSIFFLRFLIYKRKRHRVRVENPVGHQPVLHIVMTSYRDKLPPLLRIAFCIANEAICATSLSTTLVNSSKQNKSRCSSIARAMSHRIFSPLLNTL